jgi:exopolyphosphatase/guanosine-5'-triphosphate,3'-diphosphate pyrophosphatase
MSIPIGVVNLAERHGGHAVTREIYEAMVGGVRDTSIASPPAFHARADDVHLLGTSGTVTTIAGVHLELKRYERRYIDGCWMADESDSSVIERLLDMTTRSASPIPASAPSAPIWCWPAAPSSKRSAAPFRARGVRVADRGLREGMLVQMMRADNVWHRAGVPQ